MNHQNQNNNKPLHRISYGKHRCVFMSVVHASLYYYCHLGQFTSIELHNSRRIAQTDNEVLCQVPESASRLNTHSWKIACERRHGVKLQTNEMEAFCMAAILTGEYRQSAANIP